ncbi:MAG: acyl carrier protein [Pirellulaceae bacterium]
METKRNRCLTIIENVFELDSGCLIGNEELEALGWDSVTFMSFIASVDSHFGVVLAPAEVVRCETVDDLISLLESTHQE